MLRVIGAGLGRTGTNSLKIALEQLLDAPCYHMLEVNRRLTDAQVWLDALHGHPADLRELLADFAATVDWPAAALWQWLTKEHPDAIVLLSLRDNAATWLRSARATIMPVAEPDWYEEPDWASMREMDEAMFAAFDRTGVTMPRRWRRTTGTSRRCGARSRRNGSSNGARVTGGSPCAPR